jgi:hypothetical protein
MNFPAGMNTISIPSGWRVLFGNGVIVGSIVFVRAMVADGVVITGGLKVSIGAGVRPVEVAGRQPMSEMNNTSIAIP